MSLWDPMVEVVRGKADVSARSMLGGNGPTLSCLLLWRPLSPGHTAPPRARLPPSGEALLLEWARGAARLDPPAPLSLPRPSCSTGSAGNLPGTRGALCPALLLSPLTVASVRSVQGLGDIFLDLPGTCT